MSWKVFGRALKCGRRFRPSPAPQHRPHNERPALLGANYYAIQPDVALSRRQPQGDQFAVLESGPESNF
jgi:hypothetical protein